MNNVQEVVAIIEGLKTDSFAKFYIYGAVLKTMTDDLSHEHDRNSFEALLPAYNFFTMFSTKSGDCPLNIGNPDPDFYNSIIGYSRELKLVQPLTSISALLGILEKMFSHLGAITKESTTKNDAFYGAMTFGVCQKHIENYLKSAVELNRARQLLFYKLFGTAFVLLIVLQVTWGGPILLGLVANAVSLLLAYGFIQYTKQDLGKKQENYDKFANVLKENQSTYMLQTMYDRFFISSIITPVDQATKYIKKISPVSEEKIPDAPCFRR